MDVPVSAVATILKEQDEWVKERERDGHKRITCTKGRILLLFIYLLIYIYIVIIYPFIMLFLLTYYLFIHFDTGLLYN